MDGLQIPAAELDPDDFVDIVDNPYLPLTAGSKWTYTASTGEEITVVVDAERREVDGISATVVRTLTTAEQTEDWYAQDRDGNVWHLGAASGAAGSTGAPAVGWEAGQGQAQAGVTMLATPRQGDGYREELAPDVETDVIEVISIAARVELTDEAYDDVVKLEVTSPLTPGVVEERYYAEDVGLLLLETDGDQELILTAYQPADR